MSVTPWLSDSKLLNHYVELTSIIKNAKVNIVYSDRLGKGPHPNRPLPAAETLLATDSETLVNNPELLVAVAEGIDDTLRLTGSPAQYDESLLGQTQALSDIETNFLNRSGQVKVEDFLLAIQSVGEPEKPAFVLLSRDLVASNTNFIFGITLKGRGISVQSSARFEQDIQDQATLRTVMRHVARHEYGHLLGLDETSIRHQDMRGGIYNGHCTNECTMQQIMSVPAAVRQARKLAGNTHAGFCTDCVAFLAGKK